ncbi:hypothetical protein PhCBS80983_g04267 [Powellomyces hirtus]|uniref:Actin-like protein ARP6 n=1 Tax=Powellomyces hirtus TaxID=109895 RepID=A0A507DYE5_9FUNG|nr:hypothetical protein PhCBS80983_g04267 [Powellomyces hirtus]
MGRPISHAVKRIDVGGKLITNHLKEAISFRQWNMMDETFLVNEVKELCCLISQKFHEDQELCRRSFPDNTVKLDYVLPDMALGTKGFIRSPGVDAARPDEQVLVMNNERFTVPEILFNPSDIGIEQAGIPEAIIQAVQQIDPDLQGLFYSNILVVGGNAHLPGFKERLETELRSLIPLEFDLGLTVADRPDTAAWHGAVNWVRRYPENFRQKCVTRQDYLEHGHNICQQSFD